MKKVLYMFALFASKYNDDFMFFEHMPNEVLLSIASQLEPDKLLNFIFTCKRFYNLVIERITTFVNLYTRVSRFPVERFLWSEFNSPDFLIKDKQKLFLRMLRIHQVAKTDRFTSKWYNNYVHETDPFGPLPDDENELYIKNYEAWTIYSFTDVYNLLSAGFQTYAFNETDFIFFFKFIHKYKKAFEEFHEIVCIDIEGIISSGMTFEQLDNRMMRCLEYGGKEEDIYYTIFNQGQEDYDYYLTLLMHGIDSDTASAVDVIYSEDDLGCYKALSYIIGKQFAFEFVLKQFLDINQIPGFLETMSRLYSLGVNQIDIAEFVKLNPTEDVFESIRIQMDAFGSVVYKEDFVFNQQEFELFNSLVPTVGQKFAFYIVKSKFIVDIDTHEKITYLETLNSHGITDIDSAEMYIQNPTQETLDYILQEHTVNLDDSEFLSRLN